MAVKETGAPVNATTSATAQVVDTALFAAIATTSATTTTAGSSQTITVASGPGIVIGMWLTIDTGAALETVQVTAVSGTSVTAIFANAHSGTYNVVANVNRQIMSVGSPSVQAQIAEVDANNRLNTITPDITVTGQTLSASATTNNNIIANTAGFSMLAFVFAGGSTGQYRLEGSIDGTNWTALQKIIIQTGNVPYSWDPNNSSIPGSTTSSAGVYYASIMGLSSIRIRCSSTGTGSLTYSYILTNADTSVLGNYINQNVQIQQGGLSVSVQTGASDGFGTGFNGMFSLPFNLAYNGSSWDRIRKDSYANGPLWMTSGGGTLTATAAAAGTTPIKASAGRLCKVLVTTLGTAQLTFYNNASAASGTIIGIVPANTALGTIIVFDMPASLGITGDYLTNSPATTTAFW